jgi:hypothetical protein
MLVLVLAAVTGACSSGGRRDQNYGKDVGLVYEPPDGGTVLTDAAGERGEAENAMTDATQSGTDADLEDAGGGNDAVDAPPADTL